MNTTKKGDAFEDIAYGLILNAIENGKFGLITANCRVFRKKGYYSKEREKEIIFDLTIEVWSPNAERYSILYVIECKNYSHRVPVDDVEEFYSKINQVTGANRKGIMIANNSFQEGAFTYAKNVGMMIIEVLEDESHNIVLYRTNKSIETGSKVDAFESKLEKFIIKLLSSGHKKNEGEISGVEVLSRKDIESRTIEIINEFDADLLETDRGVNLRTFQKYLQDKYDLTFKYDESIGYEKNRQILGSFDRKRNVINVASEIVGTVRFPFVFAHELGHFFLHNQVTIDQKSYNTFLDSEYNFKIGRYELKNIRHWIEWQANHFAACLLMPEIIILRQLLQYQIKNGIRNKGQIYYDDQGINRDDFHAITSAVSSNLNVSKINVIFRLSDLEKIVFAQGSNYWNNYFQAE